MEFQRDGDGMELKNILADLKMINDTESGLIILIMVLRWMKVNIKIINEMGNG